jgi:cytochrome c
MESNKLFAAILTAGIIAYFVGFIAHQLTHHEPLEKNAFPIEVTASAGASGAAAAPATAEPIKDLLKTANPADGEKISKICGSCHSFVKSEGNKIGPNLAGVLGRKRGSVSDFAYSDAMKAKGGSWDADSLNEFLFKPSAFVPGTKMSFAGLKKPEDRAALIKWLQTNK